jgi:hypothetical protein
LERKTKHFVHSPTLLFPRGVRYLTNLLLMRLLRIHLWNLLLWTKCLVFLSKKSRKKLARLLSLLALMSGWMMNYEVNSPTLTK